MSSKFDYAADLGKVYDGYHFYDDLPYNVPVFTSIQSSDIMPKEKFDRARDFNKDLDEFGKLIKCSGSLFKTIIDEQDIRDNIQDEFLLTGKTCKPLDGMTIITNYDNDENVNPVVVDENGKLTHLLKKKMSYRNFAYYIIDFGISSNYRREGFNTNIEKYISIIKFSMSKSERVKTYVNKIIAMSIVFSFIYHMISRFFNIGKLMSIVIQISIMLISIYMIYIQDCVRYNKCEQHGYSIESMNKSQKTIMSQQNYNTLCYPGRKERKFGFNGKKITCTDEINEEEKKICLERFQNLCVFFNKYLKYGCFKVTVKKCSMADVGHLKKLILPDISNTEWNTHLMKAFLYSNMNDARSVIIGISNYFEKVSPITEVLGQMELKMTSDFYHNDDFDTCIFYSILILSNVNITLWSGTFVDKIGKLCFTSLGKEIKSLKIQ